MAKIIEIDIAEVIEAFTRSIEKDAYEVMKDTILDIISEWYAGAGSDYSARPLFETFNFKTSSKVNGRNGEVIITAWSEPERYTGARADALSWAKRHGYSDAGMNLFVYDLLMNQGIIGLPEHASVWDASHDEPYTNYALGWENSINFRFNQTIPLVSYIPISELWSYWEDRIVTRLRRTKVSL